MRTRYPFTSDATGPRQKITELFKQLKILVDRGDITQDEAQAALRAAVENLTPPQPGQETARRFDQLDNVALGDELKSTADTLNSISDENFNIGQSAFDEISDDEFDQAIEQTIKEAGIDGAESV